MEATYAERAAKIKKITTKQTWDMVVIGGGITGVAVAREAARQGCSVLLLEQKDYAWGTSSRSSKMVHGGLRYLASGNLKLTSHSVKERERLMKEAPGLVNLLPYVWPHYKGQFPGPKVFSVLLTVYDWFSGHKYRKYLNKDSILSKLPGLKSDGLLGATGFSDAVTDDSRLVMRVLQEANDDGAISLNYCEVIELKYANNSVENIHIKDHVNGEEFYVKAKTVISATGGWADKFRKQLGHRASIRPLRGSHLVFHSWRLPCPLSITLKHPTDNRSMFIYPWEGMTVVGTTDLDNSEMTLTEPSIQQEEVAYLLKAANDLFPNAKLEEDDIVSTFAGVRPIVSRGALKPSAEKRDHTIWVDQGLITVSGGKLTTFRLIALDVLKAAKHFLPSLNLNDKKQVIFKPSNYEHSLLNDLSSDQVQRLMGFYGSKLYDVCECAKIDGWSLVPDTLTYWAQIRFSARHESIVNLDDLLLRRTRLGLLLKEGGAEHQSAIKEICKKELDWSDDEWERQWHRYLSIWHSYYSLPNK